MDVIDVVPEFLSNLHRRKSSLVHGAFELRPGGLSQWHAKQGQWRGPGTGDASPAETENENEFAHGDPL